MIVRFQSTHPVRGATDIKISTASGLQFQSTHPVRGATITMRRRKRMLTISIHAPRAGCDDTGKRKDHHGQHFNPRTPCGVRLRLRPSAWPPFCHFNPRTPCGVRQDAQHVFRHVRPISIHAPRAGCDDGRDRDFRSGTDFNPRTPCGVRPKLSGRYQAAFRFQSTHPVRGATTMTIMVDSREHISIHAPRAGCDPLLA